MMASPALGYVAFRETYNLPGRPAWRPTPTDDEIMATWQAYDQGTRDGWERIAQAVIEAARQRG